MTTQATRRLWLMVLLMVILALGAGCVRMRRPVIPDLPTAEDQFLFALDKRNVLNRKPIKYEDMTKEYAPVIQAYERVVKRFPDDLRHTPLARVAIGTLYLKLDDPKPALAQFEHVIAQFPDDPELQAVSLTGKAEALIILGRYGEARLALLQCIETYENELSDSIKSNVVRCRRHLSRIQYQ